ncbi:short-chain dehydrogenase, partial [Shewanella xiamenensis]|nr:short-chain dehydrogenase [Shewanella xiamenensis]
ARGLGLSYARALALGGARVVISDIGADTAGAGSDASVVLAAAEALQAEGLTVIGHGGDLSTNEGCEQLIAYTLEAFGQL